ncbi:MAG TPA: trigger factor [Actinomycetota bacterium]|jgi:trigger factor|nr:trigger factor [Actinomycetota bacterium]
MQTTGIQTTAERVQEHRVRLRVEMPEEALQPAINAVYRELGQQIKVPGFRKGKVPRQIIDSRVGADYVRNEALKEAIPGFYQEALDAEGLEAIAAPEIDLKESEPGEPVVFEALVDVRPDVKVPDLDAITVEAPTEEVTDDDLNDQLDRLRDRFAELETIGREVRRGDFALIDIKGYRHEELVEGASAPDLLYEVGSRSGPPRLDEELEGNRPGAILKFNDEIRSGEMAGEELSFTVLLKEVKAKKLPDLNDDFAKTVGEFESLDELKDDLRSRLTDVKKQMAAEELRALVLDELVRASDLDAPERLVEHEFEHRLAHFEEDLTNASLTMADYLKQAGLTELELRKDMRDNALRSVKAELLLEQVARDKEFSIEQDDIGREIAYTAARTGSDPGELAKQLVASGRLGSVAADIMRRKALDYVVEHVNLTGRRAEVEEGE